MKHRLRETIFNLVGVAAEGRHAIDLFAGPGGLGEGFASATGPGGRPWFDVRLSIEKDPLAHRTLELRAFLRGFDRGRFRRVVLRQTFRRNHGRREAVPFEVRAEARHVGMARNQVRGSHRGIVCLCPSIRRCLGTPAAPEVKST